VPSQPVSSAHSAVQEVARIVNEMAGIQLGPRQFPMVENRLKTRMLRLSLETFEEYLTHLKQNRETESQALLSLMTTHHTFFFREFAHFEFLLNRGLSKLIELARQRPDKTIRVLSAACSRGQEVYSLAMFFQFHLKAAAPDIQFEIWGTDVDPESVRLAKNGVYKADELKQSPAMYLDGCWIRGTGSVRDYSKVRKELKARCHFTTANLLNLDSFLEGREFDLIFCRNVFIYFNSEQIEHVTKRLLKSLSKGGFLILGLSESLNGLSVPIESAGPSIYQHPTPKNAKATSPAPAPKPAPVRPLQVLCIDDSPAIHALLKKVLVAEEGFRIAGVAKNGREGLELLKKQKFDVITLDLHMPELDGLGFLKEKTDPTPVLVISSINRDDTSLAQKALQSGAKDYVEKPSLENLTQAGNEIRAKIKMIVRSDLPNLGSAAPNKLSKPVANSKIKVMIVDDSKTIRNLLMNLLKLDSRFEVIAELEKPSEVLKALETRRPDVITLDIHMPEMNGVQLLKKLQPRYKIPTVMISSISREEGTYVLDALAAGAVDYIQKPAGPNLSQLSRDICDRLAAAAQANVQLGARRSRRAISSGAINLESLIVMGASTGGTEALRVVLESLPREIPPILIVQHIPPVFSAAFAERLNSLCPFEVKEAADGDEILANRVLIAPGGYQMGVRVRQGKAYIQISEAPPVNRHKPSVDYLFQSVAELRLPHVIGAVLTGMGADGARHLKALRDLGARTIAQNAESCVVFGMPKEAIQRGGAEFVLPLEEIGPKLLQLCQNVGTKKGSAA